MLGKQEDYFDERPDWSDAEDLKEMKDEELEEERLRDLDERSDRSDAEDLEEMKDEGSK